MAERLRFPDIHAYACATRSARRWAETRLEQDRLRRQFELELAAERRATKRAPRWAVVSLLAFIAAGVAWSLFWIFC